jgi:hypothetical protein
MDPGREIVTDKNGEARQAGADREGIFLKEFRLVCEQNLYAFAKAVLGRSYLTKQLHGRVCSFLQKIPAYRKLVLMPREHAKTSIVAHALPIHILLQPAEGNIYFPGIDGCECRILLAGETQTMAARNLRVITSAFEENNLIKALWPHRRWEAPRRQASAWNNQEIIIPRKTEWPDPSVRAIGVGGAITGARPNVLIKDDLISIEAANSETVMWSAIEWHRASRALLEEYEKESELQSLEFIIGTRWAVFDLYSYIIDHDPSVDVIGKEFHAIIRDGKILWPERITEEFIEQKRSEYGSLYYLLYLNTAADPSLTDFNMEMVRNFEIRDGGYWFEEDEKDVLLLRKRERAFEQISEEQMMAEKMRRLPGRGTKMNSGFFSELLEENRGVMLNFKGE